MHKSSSFLCKNSDFIEYDLTLPKDIIISDVGGEYRSINSLVNSRKRKLLITGEASCFSESSFTIS